MSRPVAATSPADRPPVGIRRGAPSLIDISVRVLPSAQRPRYRAELLAELHFVPRAEQFRYAIHALIHAPSLRLAVLDAGGPSQEDLMNVTTTAARVPWACRLHLHHHWKRHFTEDGYRYKACEKCGKMLAESSLDKNTFG